jgi:hypothetical protein
MKILHLNNLRFHLAHILTLTKLVWATSVVLLPKTLNLIIAGIVKKV